MRATWGLVLCGLGLGLAGCPEGERQRERVVDEVGGAPAAQIDYAKERLEKAEQNIQNKANEAAEAAQAVQDE